MDALRQMARVSGAGMDTQIPRWDESRVGLIKKKKEKVVLKKKLKLLKGLSKDLSAFSEMGFLVDQDNDSLLQVRGKMITEAAELLSKRLEQLKADEKELKRKRKEEKAKLKAQISTLGESSDSKFEKEVIHVKSLTAEHLLVEEIKEHINGGTCCSSAVTKAKRVEVCMGNKCKKSGGGELLDEFQRIMGVEGAVVGCKCMGKCRDGPNVRLFNSDPAYGNGTPTNPLYIGVGLEDVSAIIANFFAQDSIPGDLGFKPAC